MGEREYHVARKNVKRSALFTFIAVIGLLSLGVGYAAWTGQLTVNSTLTTANAEVVWSGHSATIGGNTIAASTCAIGSTSSATNIDWSITNGVPGLTCDLSFTASNTGDVPMTVTGKTFSPDFTTWQPGRTGHPFEALVEPGVLIDFAGCQNFEVNDSVIDPGQSATCNSTVTLTDDVPEQASLSGWSIIDFTYVHP
jgi:hypothetical protein